MSFFKRAGAEIAKFLSRSSDPPTSEGSAQIYAKDVNGVSKLFTMDGAGSVLPLVAGTAFSGARLYASAPQSVANNTWTVLTYDNEHYDTDSYHDNSSNNSRLTAPTAGYYLVQGFVAFASNTTGVRQLGLWINGASTQIGYIPGVAPSTGGNETVLQISQTVYLAAGDYVELQAFQSSGGALDVKKEADRFTFTITKVGGANATAPMSVSVYQSGAQSIPDSTLTLLTYDSENFDTGSMHSTASNTGRLVAPSAGTYLYTVALYFATSSTGHRAVQVRKNAAGSGAGGTIVGYGQWPPVSSTSQTAQVVSGVVQLAAGDYIEAFAYQTSGGALGTLGSAATPFTLTLLSGTPLASSAGALSISQAASPATLDMSSEGTIDWFTNLTATTPRLLSPGAVHCKLKGGWIAETFEWVFAGLTPTLTTFSTVGPQKSSSAADTAASSALSLSMAGGYIQMNSTSASAINFGFRFRVPSSTTLRTLKLYTGHYSCELTVSASLTDNSAPAVSAAQATGTGAGSARCWTIQYSSSVPGELLVTALVTLNQRDGGNNYNAALLAATIA